jgi:hypothetical protein
MDNLSLPPLAYYTLKQAVAELNNHFHRTDLDESYLLHLAGAGSIKLSIAENSQHKFIFNVIEIGNSVERLTSRAIANIFIANTFYTPFLYLKSTVIRELSLKGIASQDSFGDLVVYDPDQAFFDSNKRERLLFLKCESQYQQLSEFQQKQLLNDVVDEISELVIRNGDFIEIKLDCTMWIRIGSIDSPTVPDLDEDNENYEIDFIEKNYIELQNFFITRHELERIINNNLRKRNNEFNAKIRKKSKWKRFPEAVFSACKALGHDPQALQSGVGEKGVGVRGEIRQWLGTQAEYVDLATEEATFKRYYQQLKAQGGIKII